MSADRLVDMANQIGRYYEAYPDRAEALKSAATHLRRFWDPRMRAALLAHLDAGASEPALDPFMLEAVRTHRSEWAPKSSAAAGTPPVASP